MLKMLIRMDNHKIETEQKYNSESIYSTLNNAFSRMRFQRISDETNALVYCDNETGQTHGSFCHFMKPVENLIFRISGINPEELVYGECK